MPGPTLAFANYIKKNWFYSFSWFFLSDLNRKQTKNKKLNCFLGVAVHPEVMVLVFKNRDVSSVPLTAVRKPSWFYEKKKAINAKLLYKVSSRIQVSCIFNRISPAFMLSRFLEKSWIPYDFHKNSLISMKIITYFNILCDWSSAVQVGFCEISCLVCFDACCSHSKILDIHKKLLEFF